MKERQKVITDEVAKSIRLVGEETNLSPQEISRLLEPCAADEWQPIETVPLEVFVRLKFGDGETSEADDEGPYIGVNYGEGWRDSSGSDYGYGSAEPTHWMPHTD